MKMKIEFEMDNSAFEEGNAPHEVHHILQHLAETALWSGLCDKGRVTVIRDSNGNRIGTAKIAE